MYEARSNIYLSVVLCMSAVACIVAILKKKLELKLGISEKKYFEGSTLFNSGLWKEIVVLCILFMFHPYPFLIGQRVYYKFNDFTDPVYYHLNDFLHMASMPRIVYAVCKAFDMSEWVSSSSHRVW